MIVTAVILEIFWRVCGQHLRLVDVLCSFENQTNQFLLIWEYRKFSNSIPICFIC